MHDPSKKFLMAQQTGRVAKRPLPMGLADRVILREQQRCFRVDKLQVNNKQKEKTGRRQSREDWRRSLCTGLKLCMESLRVSRLIFSLSKRLVLCQAIIFRLNLAKTNMRQEMKAMREKSHQLFTKEDDKERRNNISRTNRNQPATEAVSKRNSSSSSLQSV